MPDSSFITFTHTHTHTHKLFKDEKEHRDEDGTPGPAFPSDLNCSASLLCFELELPATAADAVVLAVLP